ncbi:MAG TPA: hypothetical protein DGG94_01720, partial [Micromonosporaceae bacterium]|nr:hypothetical protein [Micromonosporaceae bacterium]
MDAATLPLAVRNRRLPSGLSSSMTVEDWVEPMIRARHQTGEQDRKRTRLNYRHNLHILCRL